MTARSYAVVGGGIAGLAAALRLRDRDPGATITVYEQGGALGGKLRTGSIAGGPVELGAETFLARDPAGGDSAAVALATRVGLARELVHPAPVPAAIALDGRLAPIPGGTLLGVPGDLDAVAALAPVPPSADRDGGRPLLAPGEDVAVGVLVRARFGDAIVARLVEPMLGGVYAGRADRLSLAATMPGLAAACRVEHTLTAAVRSALAAAPRSPGAPVFATVAGGLSRLVDAVAAASGARLRLGRPVRELARAGTAWRLRVGSTRDAETVSADGVVLAVPARPAARLLSDVDALAATEVGALDYASVALVTLAVRADLPELSGLLLPADAGTTIKAATFFGRKWTHLRRPDGLSVLRASVGRYGEEQVLQVDDDALAETVHDELSTVLDTKLPPAEASRVQRWGGALPQYAPGHLARVARARATLRRGAAGLALAGAACDGVGIPLCVRSGEAAADEILDTLGESKA